MPLTHQEPHQRLAGKPPKPGYIWWVLSSIGGIATAVAVAIIGGIGSWTINRQQEQSHESQLYTQLISQREEAESKVRSDMFKEIVSSFLEPKPKGGKSCLIDDIDQQLLRLELLARNFHEMLDMEPLFVYVLHKIVRISSLKQDDPSSCNFKLLKKYNDEWKRKVYHDPKTWDNFKEDLKNHKLDKLKQIAKRIARKQKESLTSAEVQLRTISINLKDTCQDKSPIEVPFGSKCDEQLEQVKTFNNLQLKKDLKKRTFTVKVNRSYPKWNQIWVQVQVSTTMQEKSNQNDQKKDCIESKFWLSYFDFPLTENTFLSQDERYSVVLEDIENDKATISLIYFPASYAGLKEKSFYQQKLISNLISRGSSNKQ